MATSHHQPLPHIWRYAAKSMSGCCSLGTRRAGSFRLRKPAKIGSMPTPSDRVVLNVQTSGMHCRACELLVEESVSKLEGVSEVRANADRNRIHVVCAADTAPSPQAIAEAIKPHGYSVVTGTVQPAVAARPQLRHIVIAFSVVALLGVLLSKLGIFSLSTSTLEVTTFGPILQPAQWQIAQTALGVPLRLPLPAIAGLGPTGALPIQ